MIKIKQASNQISKTTLGFTEISLITLSIVLIVFSFFAPKLFIQESKNGINFSNTGEIGDTIGGIMNPFIAIAGVLLTFLAFYIQYRTNKLQREQFEIQLGEDKLQFKQELQEQKEQFKKTQFENQFYEMVRLHKENVNEISISLNNIHIYGGQKSFSESTIKGREAFKYYLEELKIGYYIAKSIYKNKSPNFLINKAYGVFYHGNKYDFEISLKITNDQDYCNFINKIININNIHKATNFDNLSNILTKHLSYGNAKNLKYKLFQGYSSNLAHYYRHLYQTVKYIANQDENFINYNEKRKYLRILRSQLSNQEQALLFYNWKSDFGKTWENSVNKFFTDYRMIHNLYNELIIEDFDLVQIFNSITPSSYRKETNRNDDSLFEFEDW